MARDSKDAQLDKAAKTSLIFVSVAALIAGVGGGWYFAGNRASEDEIPPEPVVAVATSMDNVPEDLKLAPDTVTGAVLLVSKRLERDPSAIVAAIADARKEGHLTERPEEDDLRDAPLSAAAMAPALQGEGPLAAGPLEVATLAGALLRALALGEPVYGVDSGADGGTNILRRRYLVRIPEGPWLALDGKPVQQTAIRQLTEEGMLANALAWDALSAMLQDDLRRASRTSLQAEALAPSDPAIRFTVGMVEVGADLVDKGLSTMERAASQVGDAESWMTLGVTAMGADQPFKAYRFLREAARVAPKLATPHVALAQLALERLELTPRARQPEVRSEIEGYIQAAEKRDPQAEGIPVIKAQLAVLSGHPDEADALLRGAVKQRPVDPVAWSNLAQFLSLQGRSREALETVEDAIGRGVPGVELQRMHADFLVKEDQLGDAAEVLERVLVADPRDKEVRPKLAQIEVSRGRGERAMALLLEHLDLWEGDHTTRLLAAQLELEAGRPKAAEALVKRVLKDAPDARDATLLGYLILVASGQDASKARAAAIRVLGARSRVAQVLMEQGLHEEAESLLREALIEEPSDGLAPVFLCALLVATHRDQEARILREKILARVEEPDLKQVLRTEFEAAFSQARQVVEEEGKPPPEPAP